MRFIPARYFGCRRRKLDESLRGVLLAGSSLPLCLVLLLTLREVGQLSPLNGVLDRVLSFCASLLQRAEGLNLPSLCHARRLIGQVGASETMSLFHMLANTPPKNNNLCMILTLRARTKPNKRSPMPSFLFLNVSEVNLARRTLTGTSVTHLQVVIANVEPSVVPP